MKLSEEYSYNCISIKKYFRVPICSAKTSYLINDGKNSIVKVQDRKLSHSWTLEHPHCFTSPVIFSPEEDSLFCVSDNIVLLKWFLEDETLKNASKFEFQETIFGIFNLPKRKPVILFSSGKVLLSEFLYISLEPTGKQFISEDEELVWADALVVHSEIKVVGLSLSKDQKTYKLHCISIKKREVTDYSAQLIENGDHSLKDWCLDKYNFAFITIWSNGLVSNHLLHNHAHSSLLTLRNIQDTNQLAMSFINTDHIVFAISNINKKETVLEIWDTKFTSLKAKKVLKAVSSQCYQLDAINSAIFLLANDSLMEIPCDVEKSTLATALGKAVDVSSKSEYSWKQPTGMEKLYDNSSSSVNSCNDRKVEELSAEQKSHIEKMDTDEKENQFELLAQRFIEEGSIFKTNNRELDLLELLRFALRAKHKRKQACNIEPNSLLNAIFTTSFRDAVLVQYMKKLSVEETMVILETLLDFVEDKISFTSHNCPSDLQLFDWIFLVMKSHTEALLLSKDKKKVKLLQRLDRCLSENIGVYEDYVTIQNMFHVLQKKENILPTKHVTGKYFIETIDI